MFPPLESPTPAVIVTGEKPGDGGADTLGKGMVRGIVGTSG